MVERQDKSVNDRMRAWAESAQVVASTNRVRFLKAKTDIESLLGEGWSVRKIWGFLQSEGRIEVGFSSFARDVQRLISKPASKSASATQSPSPAVLDPAPSDAAPVSTPVEPGAEPDLAPVPKGGIGSTFRVTPTPNKRDLI